MGYQNMPRVFNGYGTLIVSTSQGVTTGRKAAEKKVGGEIICTVW
jgi:small subunit ribosomal protein S8